MARTPIFPVRVDLETRAEWDAAAKRAGKSTAEFIREAVNEKLGVALTTAGEVKPVQKRGGHQPAAQGPPPTVPPTKRADAAAAARPRGRDTSDAAKGMCAHRVPLESFCGRCG